LNKFPESKSPTSVAEQNDAFLPLIGNKHLSWIKNRVFCRVIKKKVRITLAIQMHYVVALLLFLGSIAAFPVVPFPWNMLYLGCSSIFLGVSFCYLMLSRRNFTWVTRIQSSENLKEVYQALIQMLDEEKISYKVKGQYTISVFSPFKGKIVLRRFVPNSYSDTHFDDVHTFKEFYFDFHTTKYLKHSQETLGSLIIKASQQSKKDQRKLKNIIETLIERLGATIVA